MNCPSCGKANTPGSKFCKYCGASLQQKYKTCKNGHNYDPSLNECPYCPSSEVATVIKTATHNQKTVIDKQANINTSPEIVEKKEPVNKPVSPPIPSNKTKIENPPKKDKQVAESSPSTKLTGWLVSYDLEPNGIDFKLYEGKTKIGRGEYCKIIANDPSISDEHALIFCKDKKFILQDELSANGTFVNGKRIEERVKLKDGDKIKFGNLTFIIKII